MITEHLIAPAILLVYASVIVIGCFLRGFPPRWAVLPGVLIGGLLVVADLALAWTSGRDISDVLLLRRADLGSLMAFGGYAIAFVAILGVFGEA